MAELELRYVPSVLETRSQGSKLTIGGYAAVFNSLSGDLGGFIEQIAPGAFKDAIATSDTRCYWNHDDDDLPLGRLSAGTLRLSEDSTGLLYEVDLPNTETGRSVYEGVSRKDVTYSSFAFCLGLDGDTWDDPGTGLLVRTITNIEVLKDVSPVNEPAYEKATVSARALSRVEELAAVTDEPVHTYAAKRHVPADVLRLKSLNK